MTTDVPPQRRTSAKKLTIVALLSAAVIIAGAVAVILTLAASDTPDPISRAEMMSAYSRIAPNDRTADPATIDALATAACSKLDSGTSTDALISASTPVFGSKATEIVQLLASYRCPQYLSDFK